jgi:hypothetical protein
MTRWILPALGYIALTGALAITTKLALANTGWKQLLVWAAPVSYKKHRAHETRHELVCRLLL